MLILSGFMIYLASSSRINCVISYYIHSVKDFHIQARAHVTALQDVTYVAQHAVAYVNGGCGDAAQGQAECDAWGGALQALANRCKVIVTCIVIN